MRWFAALIATPLVAGVVITGRFTGALQLFEWATYDQSFQQRPTETLDDRIVLVTVDEDDIRELGRWPLSDATLAELISRIDEQQPAVIGLDLYRDIPVEPGNKALTEVMAATPHLVGVEKGIGWTVDPPPQLAQQGQVALTDVIVDTDGKVRRGILSHPNSSNHLLLGLGADLAVRYLAEQGIVPEVIDPDQKKYRLGQSVFGPFRHNDGGYIRTNAGGYQTLINFRGHLDRFHHVSAMAVLNNQVDPALMRDRIVIVGVIAPSLNDLFYTPYSSRLIDTPETAPGMLLHANMASSLLGAALDDRAMIQSWSEPVEWGWILIWSGVGAFGYGSLMSVKRHSQRMLTRLAVWMVAVVGAGGILFVSSYLAFLSGWWIPIVPAFLALIGSASAITGTEIISLQQYRVRLAAQNLQLEKDKIRAEAASQAKSQFLAKMSHELRTPLNAILGFTQLLNQDAYLTSQQRKSLNIINLSGEHLLNLINDILEISKIEADRVVLHEADFDLHNFLDMLKAMLEPKAASKGLQLHLEYSPKLSQFVIADEGKLRQVLINLINNAIKFTPTGDIVVRVSEVVREKSQVVLHFEVQDTGPGIKAEEVSKLFDSFTQGEAGKNSSEGVGLGLSISQQLVQLMGGEITFQTHGTPHGTAGTTFHFDILAMITPALKITPAMERQISRLAPNQPNFRLLIAEDNAFSRKLLNKILTSLGFQVRQATNGQEAVDLWESWQPHFIWMDMRMPVMNGCDATRQIRKKSKEHQLPDPTIVALTASAFAQDRELSLTAGCDDFVSKPFRRDELLGKLSQYLGVRYQ
ncbi:MAG: CHASE2 domain-containing protein [Cyanobacteria bacterium P01_F01_bin.53]